MPAALAVWLYGAKVATIHERRGRLRLVYTDEAFQRFPPGAPLLSLALPLVRESYTHGVVRPFLEGLLPEGEPREEIARDLHLPSDNVYGLIRALGRDCAGALVIQPDDEPCPPQPTTVTAEPLEEAQLGGLVANLRSAPLGIGDRVRLSLAGVQEKLLLTKMPDDRWGRPVDGTPSTHILKPEITVYPHTVENEAFCMRVARSLGLPVADVETTTLGGRKVIVVERFDRVVHPDGTVERIHQEDFCQATSSLPTRKYEQDGGPSLKRIAGFLDTSTQADATGVLLAAVIVNVLVGNGDAHAKNFSLLHDQAGGYRLAPFYDLLSTLLYGDDRLAMHIDNIRRMDRVTVDRILNEAVGWGLPKERASAIIDNILDGVSEAIAAAMNETPGTPEEIPELLKAQLAQVRKRT